MLKGSNPFTTSSWVSICRNPLYYIVFGSKHTSVGYAQKHFKLV